MAKLRAPIFSLEAHGSLGRSLSFQSRRNLHRVTRIPLHPDARSWPQMYHRWLYRDYATWWMSLSTAQKEAFHAAAVLARITDFNAYLRSRLTTLPDIAGLWHLDAASGGVTPDSGKNGNDATVYGAGIVPGLYQNAFHFDGVDDYLYVAGDPTLALTTELTLETRLWVDPIQPDAPTKILIAFGKSPYFDAAYAFFYSSSGNYIQAIVRDASAHAITYDPVPKSQWLHLVLTFKLPTSRFYVNNTLIGTATSDALLVSGMHLRFAGGIANAYFHGLLDESRIYNRELSVEEISEHYNRSVP